LEQNPVLSFGNAHFGSLAGYFADITPTAAIEGKADEFEQAILRPWIECPLSSIAVVQITENQLNRMAAFGQKRPFKFCK
jgi:hypothetical protein